jgi:hypothetical protein
MFCSVKTLTEMVQTTAFHANLRKSVNARLVHGFDDSANYCTRQRVHVDIDLSLPTDYEHLSRSRYTRSSTVTVLGLLSPDP